MAGVIPQAQATLSGTQGLPKVTSAGLLSYGKEWTNPLVEKLSISVSVSESHPSHPDFRGLLEIFALLSHQVF